VKRWIVVLVLVGCGKSAEPPAKLKWLSLDPLPLEIEVPEYATAGQHQESPDRNAPPGMLISARACVIVVVPGTRGPLDAQQAEIKAAHPDARIVGLTTDYFEYTYKGADGAPLRAFRNEKRIAGELYRCEPFTGGRDIGCEQRACASLRARGGP
jgi:hypothetical protein